jgi:hypothetical protein
MGLRWGAWFVSATILVRFAAGSMIIFWRVETETSNHLEYAAPRVLRGNVGRLVRILGGTMLGGITLISLGMWRFAKDQRKVKITAEIAILLLATIVFCVAVFIAAMMAVRIRDGIVTFTFCGMKMRSFAISEATFELVKLGRVQSFKIRCGKSDYVPNGAFDRAELANFLRMNGMREFDATEKAIDLMRKIDAKLDEINRAKRDPTRDA